jgi:thymidylate kinase
MKAPLNIVQHLFHRLEEEDIRHCLWKSNEHLEEALTGQTDMDLLVDESQADHFESLLKELGFKQFFSQLWARYPGIEDWIGFDRETGMLVHLHLHYQLVLGRRFVKEYDLPWEDLILNTAVREPNYDVLISDPNLEILLLGIRTGNKTGIRNILSGYTGNQPVHNILWREFEYLFGQVDADKVQDYAIQLFGAASGREFASLLNPEDLKNPAVILRIKQIVNHSLGEHRRFGLLKIWGVQMVRGLLNFIARVQRKLNIRHTQTGKRRQPNGAIVAIIGADGSGKSTLSKDIQKWLSWKIEAENIYLGSGEGSVGWLTKGLKRLASATKKKKSNGSQTTPKMSFAQQNGTQTASFVRELGSCILGLSLANERYRKVKDADKARQTGTILITDRYPQNQFYGIYDGPRLFRGADDQAVRRFFAGLEEEKYQKLSGISPDVVIKLHLPLEVALQRKPDHSAENIQRKAEITRDLKFNGAKVVDVDTSEPYEDVLRSVKQIVWESF